ncbi:hypothetical protein ACFFRR_010207 [Megaselia abdita]
MGVNSAVFKILCVVYISSFVQSYPTINLRKLIDSHYGVNTRTKKNNAPEIPDIKPDDEVKELDELRQLSESKLAAAEVKEDILSTTPKAESSSETVKTYHGGARLAFGQRPEVLPTSSSTATKIVLTTPPLVGNIPEEMLNRGTESSAASSQEENSSEEDSEEEEVDAPVVEDIEKEKAIPLDLNSTKAEERRSVTKTPPKMTLEILRYSPFDLAQYIYWTGDEASVADGLEEFVKNDMMSHENAILFLKEIHKGIKYLQNSYNNKMFYTDNDIMKKHVKKSAPRSTTTTTTTTPRPLNMHSSNINRVDVDLPTKNLDISLPIPYLASLQNEDAHTEHKDFNDDGGRAKLAAFLYKEYSLEQIIYQLSRVMFSQSLTKGSDSAQKSLQKLTSFIENEHEISPYLEKKILDVILSALSDTLLDHPELLKTSKADNIDEIYNNNRINSMKH